MLLLVDYAPFAWSLMPQSQKLSGHITSLPGYVENCLYQSYTWEITHNILSNDNMLPFTLNIPLFLPVLYFCYLHFNWSSTFFAFQSPVHSSFPRNCSTSLKVSMNDFHEDKCCSKWFVIYICDFSSDNPLMIHSNGQDDLCLCGDGLVTGNIVHDMYMYCRWWLSVHDTYIKSNWWLSRYPMRTEKNWLELLRNCWNVSVPVISTLSHSALLSFLYSQDMEKVDKRELGVWNVEKVWMLLKVIGMSDYQNIAESTAIHALVACTSRHRTWTSVIQDVLAWLTVLTGIYLLWMLELFYIDVHILST